MAETNQGWRGLLRNPFLFRAIQFLYGAPPARKRFVREHVRPWSGARILDVGCGLADIVPDLAGTEYIGIDRERGYVIEARRRYPHTRFIDADVRDVRQTVTGSFDIVLAIGLLHHLDDAPASDLLFQISGLLAPGGRLITSDPCLHPGQSWLTDRLIRLDRGQAIRSPDCYRDLASRSFRLVEGMLREDLLHLPHSIFIMECQNAV